MFTPNFYIESVQSTQKKIVETFVSNDSFKKELIKLIDAQANFAKGQISTNLEIAQSFWKNVSEAIYAKKTA